MEGAVVIGVSAGGMTALKTILPKLPHGFCLPIIIVSHRHPDSDDYLERHLDSECAVTVKRARQNEKITPGTVYIAPPNYHLRIEKDFTFSLSQGPPVNHARPSIDVLFDSAADVYGPLLTGIVLTGANDDGSRGLKKIKESGGLTAAQDPRTA
ncbi:MAG: chemotaxis protein CheB, partial [Candidatus Aminicenantes bacterium]|nr:chemotaxis protein CheB [Candidatus Aminicenantes bacterium]